MDTLNEIKEELIKILRYSKGKSDVHLWHNAEAIRMICIKAFGFDMEQY